MMEVISELIMITFYTHRVTLLCINDELQVELLKPSCVIQRNPYLSHVASSWKLMVLLWKPAAPLMTASV